MSVELYLIVAACMAPMVVIMAAIGLALSTQPEPVEETP